MRAVVQRVSWGTVEVDGERVGEVQRGILVLLGAEKGDDESDALYLAEKTAHLRIFEDADGKMNLSLLDVGGQVLAVSQFTLVGDCRKGRRPSFARAMEPSTAEQLFECYVERVREIGPHVETGRFRTNMDVSFCNQGPVTLLLDSRKGF